MNLLCPNCQKMLTVPEQSAGQTMRCPLCTGTFTVPSLPTSAPAAPLPAPPPAGGSPALGDDIFRVEPPKVAPPPKWEEPAKSTASPEPASSAQVPPPPSGGVTGYTLTLHPHVVPWIAPAALVAVFILLFFPWTGTLVPGVERPEWYTQSGWSNAFGNGLGIVSILLFLLALPVAVAVVALPILDIKLPSQLDMVWPWRLPIVAGLVGAATLFLILQLATASSLESKLDGLTKNPEQFKDDELAKKFKLESERAVARNTVYHSTWLRLALVCHLIALAGLGLQYWLQQRGNRPLPHVDIIW